MPFEDFDDRIRKAAEQHHPNYDEKAWSKMETLLDKHMPQKDERRRRLLFFILLGLGLLTGGALLIRQPWKNTGLTASSKQIPGSNDGSAKKKNEVSLPITKDKSSKKDQEPVTETTGEKQPAQTSSPAGQQQADHAQPSNDAVTGKSPSIINPGRPKAGVAPIIANAVPQKNNRGKRAVLLVSNRVSSPLSVRKPGSDRQANDVTSGNRNEPGNNNHSDAKTGEKPGQQDGTVTAGSTGESEPGADTKKDQPLTVAVAPATDVKPVVSIDKPKDDTAVVSSTTGKSTARKSAARSSNRIVFSLSAGPDVSSVGSSMGKMRILTGAGAGYVLRDRFMIRTGFYSASKVYSARPAQYKPVTPIPNTTYLTNIDANCRVYEIPLNFAYLFGQPGKQQFFVSAGLSSFIMKKEKYDYLYEYPSGTSYTYTHLEKNENKHYFSVLGFSVGYQRRLSNSFSIVAEPYYKLPLAGVGYGRVKLNSLGMMVSLNFSPFQKAMKK